MFCIFHKVCANAFLPTGSLRSFHHGPLTSLPFVPTLTTNCLAFLDSHTSSRLLSLSHSSDLPKPASRLCYFLNVCYKKLIQSLSPWTMHWAHFTWYGRNPPGVIPKEQTWAGHILTHSIPLLQKGPKPFNTSILIHLACLIALHFLQKFILHYNCGCQERYNLKRNWNC